MLLSPQYVSQAEASALQQQQQQYYQWYQQYNYAYPYSYYYPMVSAQEPSVRVGKRLVGGKTEDIAVLRNPLVVPKVTQLPAQVSKI